MTRRIPLLETERLIIRELEMDDLAILHPFLDGSSEEGMTRDQFERWLQWTVLGYEMFAMLDQPHFGERGIALKDGGRLIGAIGIVPYIDDFGNFAAIGLPNGALATAEVGLYWLVAQAYQGQGYASEAAGAVIEYLFSHLKLRRVIATTGHKNLASQAVMRKIGMTVEYASESQSPNIPVLGVLYHPGLRKT